MSGQLIVLDAVRLRRAADRLAGIASRQAQIARRLRWLSTTALPPGPWQAVLAELDRIGAGLASLSGEVEELVADLRRRARQAEELEGGFWPNSPLSLRPARWPAVPAPVSPLWSAPGGSVLVGAAGLPWPPPPKRRLDWRDPVPGVAQLTGRIQRAVARHPLQDLEMACILLGLIPEMGLPFNLAAAALEFGRGDDPAAAVSLAAAAADLVGVAVEIRAVELGGASTRLADLGSGPLRAAPGRGWEYADLPAGVLGGTLPDGTIRIQRGLEGKVLEETVRHELVHSYLRRLPPVRVLVVRLYPVSELWRYLEELAAETYATGRPIYGALFPIRAGYVTVKGLVTEAATGAAGAGMGAAAWHATTSRRR